MYKYIRQTSFNRYMNFKFTGSFFLGAFYYWRDNSNRKPVGSKTNGYFPDPIN
jgi:hypothetical protein